jgi:hypothetical protein
MTDRYIIKTNDGTLCTGVWDNDEARACPFVVVDTAGDEGLGPRYPVFAKTHADAERICAANNETHRQHLAREAAKVEITTAGYTRKVDPAVAKRIKIERQVISAFVKSVLSSKLTITVDNGEEKPVVKSTSYKAIMAAIMATDEEHLRVYDTAGKHLGSAYMVYGNDGYDVICDYHTSLEELMTPVNVVIDRLAERA